MLAILMLTNLNISVKNRMLVSVTIVWQPLVHAHTHRYVHITTLYLKVEWKRFVNNLEKIVIVQIQLASISVDIASYT